MTGRERRFCRGSSERASKPLLVFLVPGGRPGPVSSLIKDLSVVSLLVFVVLISCGNESPVRPDPRLVVKDVRIPDSQSPASPHRSIIIQSARNMIFCESESRGSGVELQTPVIGAAMGLREGVELSLFGLSAGFSLAPPSLKIPVVPPIPRL